MGEQMMNWGEAFTNAVSSAASMFMGSIPKILAFLAILIIGWIIAAGLAQLVAMVLRKLRFNDAAEKAGISRFITNAGLQYDASMLVAQVVKWFVRLIALVAAFNALGLPEVSAILGRLLQWLPNLFVSLVILTVGGWAANAVAILVRGASVTAQSNNPDLAVKVAKSAVWVFTVIVAFNQLGIASELIQILFMAITGGLAIGFALAVGLGAKDLVNEWLRNWLNKKD